MRSSHFRSIAALLVALGLTACGGKASFTINGTISGLLYPGLVLANGSDTVAPAVNATTFTFPNQIDYGTEYNIVAQTQPTHMTCAVTAGTGSAGHTATIAAHVTCAVNTFALGGSISGLTAGGLELANGSVPATVLPVSGATTFAFANVAFGQAYGVTVLTQPAGLVCSVANGTGTMGDAAIANIAISCQPA